MENRPVSGKKKARRAGRVWVLGVALCAGLPAAVAQDTGEGAVTPDGATGSQVLRPQVPGAGQAGVGREDVITLSESAEPIAITTLIEYVAETLNVNIAAPEALTGNVILAAPTTVRRGELIPLLDAFLEQQAPGYTIIMDRPGFYRIIPVREVPAFLPGDMTTRIIPTPNLRPSSLHETIQNQFARQGELLKISYLDDLGVIVATDTPRRVEAISHLVRSVLERAQRQEFMRFDLQHIAASVARTRVLELVGLQQGQVGLPGGQVQLQPQVAGMGITPGAMAHLGDRLLIDPQGNALILRGFQNEADRIASILEVLDRPNTLEARQYTAGAAAMDIARFAESVGLGKIQTIDTGAVQGGLTQPAVQGRPQAPGQPLGFQQQFQQQATGAGGPTLVVDESRGMITYYGTPSQHARFAEVVQTFDVGRNLLVIETYKLRNTMAEAVAEVIQAILTNETPAGGSAFLPGAGGQRGAAGRATRGPALPEPGQPAGRAGVGAQQGAGQTGGPLTAFGVDEIFVVADRANNQLLVKAPARQQPEFAKLIDRLDQRRPQVYINVQIVAVTDSDDFRLAVETQLINAGGTGGVINTNFGLGTFPGVGIGPNQPSTILARKNVATNLGGITAAIIRSDHVPIIVNAIKTETDARILSSPQLLVDDNETASIASIEQQPTSTASQGQATTVSTFGGYEDAGTQLTVTPSISEGGYMRLAYEISLSNFVGTGFVTGETRLPPVRQERTVSSDSVTIPDGATIVVGGITVNATNSTVIKVPLLGDIPLLGHLFRDTNKATSDTRLYVFITPTILRDPTFRDLLLLSQGPQAEAGIAPDMPELSIVTIRMREPEASRPGRRPGGAWRREDDPLSYPIAPRPGGSALDPEWEPESVPEPELTHEPMQ
jgi:type II secretory pathway component GspD/PulD (secretin)